MTLLSSFIYNRTTCYDFFCPQWSRVKSCQHLFAIQVSTAIVKDTLLMQWSSYCNHKYCRLSLCSRTTNLASNAINSFWTGFSCNSDEMQPSHFLQLSNLFHGKQKLTPKTFTVKLKFEWYYTYQCTMSLTDIWNRITCNVYSVVSCDGLGFVNTSLKIQERAPLAKYTL